VKRVFLVYRNEVVPGQDAQREIALIDPAPYTPHQHLTRFSSSRPNVPMKTNGNSDAIQIYQFQPLDRLKKI